MHFTSAPDPGDCCEIVVRAADGSQIALLHKCDREDGALVLDAHQDIAITLQGAWTLEIIDRERRAVWAHVLLLPPEPEVGCERLTPDVAAWAMSTLLWELDGGEYRQG